MLRNVKISEDKPPPILVMASKPPPLQLQFTVQGAMRVLPLTTENVACVFNKGVLTKGYFWTFGQELGIPSILINNPFKAAAWWVKNGKDRRWRVIIFLLDEVGETRLADELLPFSEPPSDSSLTVDRVIPIFMNIKEWGGMTIHIPDARAEIIEKQYQLDVHQRQQGALYYINVHPDASWEHLAGRLYQCAEERAIVVFKIQIPKPKDPTLTVENMLRATEEVDMPKEAKYSGEYLDMPKDTYNELMNGEEERKQLFTEFLFHHPYPSWDVIVKLLYLLESRGRARAGLAQEVKDKYLTSVCSLFNLCLGHIVNNYEFYQPLLPQLLPHHVQMHIELVLLRL